MKTGVQRLCNFLKLLDSGFRGNDGKWCHSYFFTAACREVVYLSLRVRRDPRLMGRNPFVTYPLAGNSHPFAGRIAGTLTPRRRRGVVWARIGVSLWWRWIGLWWRIDILWPGIIIDRWRGRIGIYGRRRIPGTRYSSTEEQAPEKGSRHPPVVIISMSVGSLRQGYR